MKDQIRGLINHMIESGIQYSEAVSEFEKQFILRMLEENKGNQSKTAEALGIHRNTLSRKKRRAGLGSPRPTCETFSTSDCQTVLLIHQPASLSDRQQDKPGVSGGPVISPLLQS